MEFPRRVTVRRQYRISYVVETIKILRNLASKAEDMRLLL